MSDSRWYIFLALKQVDENHDFSLLRSIRFLNNIKTRGNMPEWSPTHERLCAELLLLPLTVTPVSLITKKFSVYGVFFLNAFILLILYTIYSIPNYDVTMHVSFARVWNVTELEELEAEISFLEMYKPFSKRTWVVLNSQRGNL